MQVETDDTGWVNTRFILSYFYDGNWVFARMINNDVHKIFYSDTTMNHDMCEKLVKFISVKKLSTKVLSKHDIYAYMGA